MEISLCDYTLEIFIEIFPRVISLKMKNFHNMVVVMVISFLCFVIFYNH